MQEGWALLVWYFPDGQTMQESWALLPWYLPSGQPVHTRLVVMEGDVLSYVPVPQAAAWGLQVKTR